MSHLENSVFSIGMLFAAGLGMAAGAIAVEPAAGSGVTTNLNVTNPLISTNRPPSRPDVTRFTMDQLLEMKVTSVSKKPEGFFGAPAALSVITSEEIRRSGARILPEALRLSPGLDVAQIDASKWAISSRGFNERLANKLLVLIDGRSVYDPAFSGLYWETQDLVLEDIDRIEVIRGPGGTLWGANAVNGVINITTKSAKETQGLYLEAGGGNVYQGFDSIRYGGKLGENAYYRVYEKYINHTGSFDPAGHAADDWRMARGGVRVDWDVSESDVLTWQGDVYRGEIGAKQIIPFTNSPYALLTAGDAIVEGANALGRWQHTLAEDNQASLQMYYDHFKRDDLRYQESRDTFDLDFQHRLTLGSRNEIVYGLGYRYSADRILGAPATFYFNDASRGLNLESAFLQDTLEIVPDRLHLTLGSKLGHNDFTGVEIQPGPRLLWTPQERHALWASVARAVRTPSRVDDGLQAHLPYDNPVPPYIQTPPATIRIGGNPAFESESLIAYELGYRVRPADRLTFDLALFYNDYDKLRLGEFDFTNPRFPPQVTPGYIFLPVLIENKMKGETYGAELSARWNPTDNWKLSASYSYLKMQLHLPPVGLYDPISGSATNRSPRHQFQLHSLLDLNEKWQLDTGMYYVDSLPTLHVSSYIRLDARIAWHPTKDWEVSLAVQNLLDNHHPEFGASLDNFDLPTEPRRSVYASISCRF